MMIKLRLFRMVLLGVLTLWALMGAMSANAVTYANPTSIGCTLASGTTYNCSALAISTATDFTGTFTLNVTGTVTLTANLGTSTYPVNVIATQIITVDNNVTVYGNLTSTFGPSGTKAIELKNNSKVYGDVTALSGMVTLGNSPNTKVFGNLLAATVDMGNNAQVSGNCATDACIGSCSGTVPKVSNCTSTSPLAVTVSGTVFEDKNYGGGAGRSLAGATGNNLLANARVELYNASGSFVSFVTSGVGGTYSFGGLARGTYTIRVVNSSVRSARTGNTAALIGVQTFRTNASSGSAVAETNRVGGETPGLVDAGNGSTTLGALSPVAQSVTSVDASSGNVSGVDFGFSFSVVVNTNNSGQGSLRQVVTNLVTLSDTPAITDLSGRSGLGDVTIFMIPDGVSAGTNTSFNFFATTCGSGPNVATISSLSTLTVSGLRLDAQTHPAYVNYLNANPLNPRPLIEISGSLAPAGTNGITGAGNNTFVSGFIINRFKGDGINSNSNGSRFEGSWVGLDCTGNAAAPNTGIGVNFGAGGSFQLGMRTAAAPRYRMVVSGNGSHGVQAGQSMSMRGSYIGTNATGTAAVGNGGNGINWNTTANPDLNSTAAYPSVISGNAGWGVYAVQQSLAFSGITNTVIGRSLDGSTAAPNALGGVYIARTTDQLGTTCLPINNSTIASNGGPGIRIDGGTAAQKACVNISQNSIYGNTGLGIDLAPGGVTGVTLNDGAVSALGNPNLLMDYPVFSTATLAGNNLTVVGYIGTAPNQNAFSGARVEVFRADASANVQGQTYLGTLTADGNGNFSGVLDVTGKGVVPGDKLVGTAADAAGNTSEFTVNASAVIVAGPTLSIANASIVEGNSGQSNLGFTVTLSTISASTVSATYTLTSGSATGGAACTSGVDFINTGGTVNIIPGATTATINVPICGDSTYEGDESFTITLSSPVNATLAPAFTATGSILNDDAPPLVAEYHFDETLWNGTTGEVIDSSGNGYHATSALLTSASGAPGPAYTSGGQSTCRYGVFGAGGANSYVRLPNSFPGLSGSFSITAWLNSKNASAGAQRVFVRDDANNGWAMSLADFTNTAILRFFNRSVSFNSPSGGVVSAGGVAIDTSFQLSSNTWYFVALTVDTVGKTVVMYVYDVNGVQKSRMSASFTGTWSAGTGATSIGAETSASSETNLPFVGWMDELRVFSGALTQTLVEVLLPTVRSCVAGPDHYELSLPTASINCLPTTVTVTACANNSSPCTSTYSAASGATATLGTSGATLGATSVTFNAGGVATTTLSYPLAADGTAVSVTLSGESMTATNARQCCANGTACSVSNSCSSTFNTAGFILSNSAGGATATIPTQTAGTTSGILYLRAVKTTTETAACSAALTGTSSVNMAYQCNNPTTCYGTNLMSINGGTATTIQGNPNTGVSSYTAVPMTFDAAGNAPFTLNYSDVGQTTLWFSKVVNSATLTGTSNAFVTKPGGFLIAGVKQTAVPQLANPGSVISTTPAATDAKFIKAGEAFGATVSAVTSGGTETPNYGRETTPEGVQLTHALVAPSGGNSGTLSNGTITGGSFTNGVATVTNLAWDEVGFISLSARVADSDYLGVGNVSTPHGFNIGRFIPDHFAITAGTVAPACSNAFTYFGQDFAASPASNAFATPFTLTAQNLSNGTTQNYTDGFAKLALTTWGAAPASAVAPGYGFSAATLPAGATLSSSTTAPTGSWPSLASAQPSRGVASITARHKVSRPTALTGITSLTVSAAPVDSDGVAMASTAVGAASNFYYGRLRMRNAYGSELLALPMSLTTEYWTTTGWVKNTLDGCTAVPVPTSASGLAFGSGNLSAGETVASIQGITTGNGTFIAGDAGFRLSKPGTGNTGFVTITIATPDWLKFPWVTAGVDVNASARATFGIYKSPLIYRREKY